MTTVRRRTVCEADFLALPLAAQYVTAWQALTGLGWDDVFADLPTALNVANGWSYFDALLNGGYYRKDYSFTLTAQARQVIASVIFSPDYTPGALIDKAFWDTMATWQEGDTDEQSLRWQALLRHALINNRADSDVVLTDCLTHESAAMLANFCKGVAGWGVTPALLSSYTSVVQGLLLWIYLRGLYVSGVALPKPLDQWRAAFFAFPVEKGLPPLLCYLLGQIAFCWGDMTRASAWFECTAGADGKYGALGQLALAVLSDADDITLQTKVKQAKRAATGSKSTQSIGCNDPTGIFLAIRQLHAGANSVRLLEGLTHPTAVYWPALEVTDAVAVLTHIAALQGGERERVIDALQCAPLHQTVLAQSLTPLLMTAVYAEEKKCPDNPPEKASVATLRTVVWAEIAQRHSGEAPPATAMQAIVRWPPMLPYLPMKASWEYAMAPLEQLIQATPAHRAGDKRWTWRLAPTSLSLSVVEQTLNTKGRWSPGRALSLQRLYQQDGTQWPGATAQDMAAMKTLQPCAESTATWWREETVRVAFEPETLLTLVGHPYVFHADRPSQRLELTQTTPSLWVCEEDTKEAAHYRVRLSHPINDAPVLLDMRDMNHYDVIDCRGEWATLARLLGPTGIVFPAAAKSRVMRLIQDAKPGIAIQTDVAEAPLPSVPASTALYLHCIPEGDAIWVQCGVRPLGEMGPTALPGEGNPMPVAVIMQDGASVRTRTVRDFAAERKAMNALYKACPEIKGRPGRVEGREAILSVLMRLQAIQATQAVTVEWPKGQRFRLRKTITDDALALHITGDTDWFSVSAEVTIDEDSVLDMRALLDSVRTSGQFIALGRDEFVALSETLTRQLQALDTVIDDEGRLLTLGEPIVAALAKTTTKGSTSRAWKKQAKRWDEAQALKIRVPTALNATLRDYQVQGFEYLARMAAWGMGACLADDMGLGKTVQAIALLVHLAKTGPALIVAPASVCYNWTKELARFAPTLQVVNGYTSTLNDAPKMSAETVYVCSYGVLTANQSSLCQQSWQTVIVDEAQAIKNPGTQRWRAVNGLNAAHRFALTGTPIENHLGELWSLFAYLNPGYLGSLKAFQTRFMPTAAHATPGAHEALKQAIAPFLLRRTKAEVLPMLPEKTNQTVYVTLSADERAFYEALRQRAVARLSGETETVSRMTLFNELTRLRQACCHPKLIDSQSTLTSSKLAAVQRLMAQLLNNGHKVLVFSQFVRYLACVKPLVEALGVSYHYLDGQTPVLARQRAIDAFQAGEGEVFLISLKAGGSGLNLTAADDVIHLDPWWNPAVEDQAADRAHRMGQTKPVTVYRMVTQDTIEEQIVALHSQKRALADAVLSGQGGTGQLTTAALEALLQRTAIA